MAYVFLPLVWLSILSLLGLTYAHTHEFNWTVSHKVLNPDGLQERKVVVINDQWPAPQVRVHKDDRVVVHLTNNFTEEDTSLHFHGIFQRGSSFMDGPSMISQCPIPPGETFTYNFTVEGQSGTYWYHSHSAAQYGDGLRGVFIIEDDADETDLKYDADLAIILSDWYHTESQTLVDGLFTEGSYGNEPHIDSSLFNESASQDIKVEPGKTYLLRVVNAGMSATQLLYAEDHIMTIVEIDGVKVHPQEVDSLSISTGQRYAVLIKTKDTRDKNYPLVQMTNIMMRKRYTIQWLVYDESLPMDSSSVSKKTTHQLNPVDDITLIPMSQTPLLPNPTHQITLEYDSDYYGEGRTRYYTINGHPHLSPRVPTINTIFSANATSVNNPSIYGAATNAILISKDDIIEIVVNSYDHMKHPFHLHGHNFQVIARGSREHYDPDKDYQFPSVPMIRDTINVPGRGFVVLRFKADNPGVWFFHCHTEWHAVQGLGVVFVEAADEVLKKQVLPLQNREICEKGGIKAMGNAAGNKDMDNMEGEVKVPELNQYTKGSHKTSATSTTAASASTSASETSLYPSETSTNTDFITDDTPLKTKAIVLLCYGSVMTLVTALFAICVQRSTHRKRRTIPLSDYS
ncbi:Iron transport multicopper oxidase FET3 [Cyberlindnera fabianii]|uniref:Iron transport multicopper oxidase FET3 n=1 Tax=Cyberlindnera fabianii TaxID=36022 RepID=A0A1V2KZI9_CYBFA|nr:Iron transport multicopper oxidase FET3 [Cyberlindnera fabianii]